MKKALKVILITVLCLGLAGGGVFAVLRFTGNKTVDVVPASDYLLSYMPNQTYISGSVVSDAAQNVYKEEDMKILEVLVQPGQQVSVGDPLLRYDATLDSIALAEKQLEREKLFLELEEAYKEYQRYARTPYPRTIPTATPAPTATPKANIQTGAQAGNSGIVRLGNRMSPVLRALPEPNSGSGTAGDPYVYTGSSVSADFIAGLLELAKNQSQPVYALMQSADGSTSVLMTGEPEGGFTFTVTAPETAPQSPNLNKPLRGKGTAGSPYVYAYASGYAVPQAFILDMQKQAAESGAELYATLSATTFAVPMIFGTEGSISLSLTAALPTPSPSPTPSPTPSPSPDPSETPEGSDMPVIGGGGLSKADREALAQSIAKDIRNKEVQYRQLGLDIQKLQMAGAEGLLLSEINGVVTSVNDYESTPSGEVLISVQGGTGLYIVLILGEMDLAEYPVGTEMTGYSYDSGQDVSARVRKVNKMPLTTSYYGSTGNNNSGYLVELDILGDTVLQAGEYVEFSGYQSTEDTGAIYLDAAYIREIDGEDCIFIARDGVLVKEKVNTGKRVYSYVELIDSSLTMEDYIAFPYGKTVREGAPVRIPEEGENLVIW